MWLRALKMIVTGRYVPHLPGLSLKELIKNRDKLIKALENSQKKKFMICAECPVDKGKMLKEIDLERFYLDRLREVESDINHKGMGNAKER